MCTCASVVCENQLLKFYGREFQIGSERARVRFISHLMRRFVLL